MNYNKAATIIQQAWHKYIAPRCRYCLFPIELPYGPIFPYSCTCHRCPGCLKFNEDSKPCSIGCQLIPTIESPLAHNFMGTKSQSSSVFYHFCASSLLPC